MAGQKQGEKSVFVFVDAAFGVDETSIAIEINGRISTDL